MFTQWLSHQMTRAGLFYLYCVRSTLMGRCTSPLINLYSLTQVHTVGPLNDDHSTFGNCGLHLRVQHISLAVSITLAIYNRRSSLFPTLSTRL